MKHTYLFLSLAFTASLALTACGDGETTDDSDSTATDSVATEEPEPEVVETPSPFPATLMGYVMNPVTDPTTLSDIAENKGYMCTYVSDLDKEKRGKGFIAVKVVQAKASQKFPMDLSSYKPVDDETRIADFLTVGDVNGWMTYSKVNQTATFKASLSEKLQLRVELLGGEWKPEDLKTVLEELDLTAFSTLAAQ